MGALVAAAVLGSGFFSSLWQLSESLWAIPVAVAALCTAAVGVLVWRARRRPVSPGDPRDELGDDTIAMLRYCPWCEPFPSRPVGAGECTCTRPCEGVSYCLAAVSRG
jgi:hypothetical protein